jgi:hypothetical protein
VRPLTATPYYPTPSAACSLQSATARQQKTGVAKVEACRDELEEAQKALESLQAGLVLQALNEHNAL